MSLQKGLPNAKGLKALLSDLKPRTALVYQADSSGQKRRISKMQVLLTRTEHQQGISFKDIVKDELSLSLLMVDHELFERDVKESALGDFMASRLITPYKPLCGKDELDCLETILKRRTIVESLENLILEYSTLATELIISPEYFPHADLQRLARAYPILNPQFHHVTTKIHWKENLHQMTEGYVKALRRLKAEGKIILQDGMVRIADDFLRESLERSTELVEILGSIQKAARPFVLAGRAIAANPLSIAKQVVENAKEDLSLFTRTPLQLEEPDHLLFLETGKEILPISRKLTIDDFITKLSGGETTSEIRRERLFGFLNSVYLLSVRSDSSWNNFVVKTFLDWHGYKWFPLAIWTLGVQDFAVSGKRRMANEYVMSRSLRREGLEVPEIFDISWDERLIFEEFIEGRSLNETISNALLEGFSVDHMKMACLAGVTVGRTHELGFCLGDCKPENMIFSNDSKLYLVDLEQARVGGNPAWDIAEFLYYAVLFTPTPKQDAVKELAVNFLRGYLESCKKHEHLSEAGSAKYYSVFAPFEPRWVLIELSKVCQDPMSPNFDKFYVETREEHLNKPTMRG